MYSLVLMTAMTTTPSTPEFNGFFREMFNFRGGCTGTCMGCGGQPPTYACYGGCSGYTSCNGCCGGETFRDRMRRIFSRNNCNGCCGGCNGGCCGGLAVAPMAPMIYGSPYAVPPAAAPMIPYAPPEAAPAPPAPIIGDRIGVRPAAATAPGTGARGAVVVRLPADARLYAGEKLLNLTGDERQFVTPALPAGQDYTYRFRVEYEREGETISVTRRVAVRPGSTASLEFTDLGTARPTPKPPSGLEKPPAIATATAMSSTRGIPSVLPVEPAPLPAVAAPAATERATLMIRIPAGATLYVDGRKAGTAGAETSFRTPPLPAGREFSYMLKAEILRDGRPESLTQKVSFRAGERITVDFGSMGN